MLLRILVWLLLILAAWWLLRGKRSRPVAPPPAQARPPAPAARTLAPPEAMVDCAFCGLHLPASEALRDAAGLTYCCVEHRAREPGSR